MGITDTNASDAQNDRGQQRYEIPPDDDIDENYDISDYVDQKFKMAGAAEEVKKDDEFTQESKP